MSLNSSSNSSLHPPPDERLVSRTCSSIFTVFFTSYILLLLLFIFVLYVGYRRWRKQRSVATAATTSHSDVFTFNMVGLELISFSGLCCLCFGIYTNRRIVWRVGMEILFIISPGQTLFHLLTCVERYLAVVHPVTYLGLRQAGGVRIRNISSGCVWLLCFGSLGLSVLNEYFYIIYCFVLLASSFTGTSFCSLSVLRALIRPGPGEVGGKREQVDQTKQRAFHTIMVILGALLLRFLSSLVFTVMISSSVSSTNDICLVVVSVSWFSLPSSLVLPLLFLHRAGKLPDCQCNTVSASELG